MVAAAGGFDDVVAYLLERGADPQRQSQVWWCLDVCVCTMCGLCGVLLVSLSRAPPCILPPTPNTNTPTHVNTLLLPQGGKTALHWAARHGERRACRVLLQARADVRKRLLGNRMGGDFCECPPFASTASHISLSLSHTHTPPRPHNHHPLNTHSPRRRTAGARRPWTWRVCTATWTAPACWPRRRSRRRRRLSRTGRGSCRWRRGCD